MRYKILGTIWFTPPSGDLIGIVAIDSDGNGWKAYIGVAPQITANFPVMDIIDAQEQYIAEKGVPVGKDIALGAFPYFNRNNFLS